MALKRSVPVEGEFPDRPFIPQGVYLSTVTQVRDKDDQGNKFTTTFGDKTRDAIVIVFRIEEIMSGGEFPDVDTYNTNTTRNPSAPVGDTMGKKMTDSLHEKANLRKVFEGLTGLDCDVLGDDIDLEAMQGRRAIIKVVETEKYDEKARLVRRSYVETITPHYERQAAPAGPRVRGAAPQPVAAGGIPDHGEDVPF